MTFTANDLTTKAAFKRSTYEQDETGQPIYTWTTYAQAFVRFEPLLGREFFAAAQTNSEAQAKVTLRWMDGVLPADRIEVRGEAWDIVSIQNIAYRNRELLIYVKRNPVAV